MKLFNNIDLISYNNKTIRTISKSGGPTTESRYTTCYLDSSSRSSVFENPSVDSACPNTNASGVYDYIVQEGGDGIADSGNCSAYSPACSTNFTSDITNAFAPFVAGEVVDDADVSKVYGVVQDLITERKFTNNGANPSCSVPIKPGTVAASNIIDDNHYDIIKNWADSFSVNPQTSAVDAGDIINAAGWIGLSNRIKNIAKLCNVVNICNCENVCSCNKVCTCNCNSNY
jgi:hypothetical protein